MKKHEELISEPMPPELESRILRHAAPALLARRQAPSRRLSFRLWGTLLAGAATAAFAFVYLRRMPSPVPATDLAFNEEFLDHLEMLQHMDEIRHEGLLKSVIGTRV
jgi:hypothetical protein